MVINEQDKRVLEKRLSNGLPLILETFSPYRDTLQGMAVESSFNRCWLVHGLQEQGFDLQSGQYRGGHPVRRLEIQ